MTFWLLIILNLSRPVFAFDGNITQCDVPAIDADQECLSYVCATARAQSDIGLKRVLADFLEESADEVLADWGAFMRLQIEDEFDGPLPDRKAEIAAELEDLFARSGRFWIPAPIPISEVSVASFRTGFLQVLAIPIKDLIANPARTISPIFQGSWVKLTSSGSAEQYQTVFNILQSSGLTKLSLIETPDKALQQLAGHEYREKLEGLEITIPRTTRDYDVFRYLSRARVPGLKHLHINNLHGTGDGFTMLQDYGQLGYLRYAGYVGPLKASVIATMPNIKILDLSNSKLGDDGYSRLVNLDIEDLNLKNTGITYRSLLHLGTRTKLKRLILDMGEFNTYNLHQISGLPNLEVLSVLTKEPVHTSQIESFGNLQKLEDLAISIDGDLGTLKAFKGLVRLKRLKIVAKFDSGYKHRAEDVAVLANMKDLVYFEALRSSFTDEALAKLIEIQAAAKKDGRTLTLYLHDRPSQKISYRTIH